MKNLSQEGNKSLKGGQDRGEAHPVLRLGGSSTRGVGATTGQKNLTTETRRWGTGGVRGLLPGIKLDENIPACRVTEGAQEKGGV